MRKNKKRWDAFFIITVISTWFCRRFAETKTCCCFHYVQIAVKIFPLEKRNFQACFNV